MHLHSFRSAGSLHTKSPIRTYEPLRRGVQSLRVQGDEIFIINALILFQNCTYVIVRAFIFFPLLNKRFYLLDIWIDTLCFVFHDYKSVFIQGWFVVICFTYSHLKEVWLANTLSGRNRMWFESKSLLKHMMPSKTTNHSVYSDKPFIVVTLQSLIIVFDNFCQNYDN